MSNILDQHDNYSIQGNTITFQPTPPSTFVRSIIYIVTVVSSLIPILIVIGAVQSGNGFKFGHFIGIGLNGLIIYYLLRISLWNTFGKEQITIEEKEINYSADYGWFKDKIKTTETSKTEFAILPVGYEEDGLGVIVILSENKQIKLATKLPLDPLDKIATELNIIAKEKPNP